MRLKKLLWGSVLTALALAAAAGHVVYWYLPRERTGVPQPETPMGRLLASDYPVALWIPYPHQNLAFLGSGEAGGEGLRAAARLAGLPTPELPSFGPLPVPPATAMAVASDESGERYVVLAEVYPAFAAFAKLAGRLADNPWLRGGEIYVGGRRAEVSWRGNLWAVASPELPALDAPTRDAAAAPPPSLAVIRVRQAAHPLPSGGFLLRRHRDSLEIVSADVSEIPEPELGGLGLPGLGVFLLTYGGANPALGEPAEALVGFVATDPDTPEGNALELPQVARLWEGGARRSLPGESILELAGRRPREGAAAGWSIAALDTSTLERSQLLAPRLSALRDSPGGLTWFLWFDLVRGLSEVSRFAERLSEVPIVPQEHLQQWRDVHASLRPVAERYSRLSIVVTQEPRALRLRLDPAVP